MGDQRRSLTHCPSCGREVDRLRAGSVGIFSGKMSYFCSRECRDRFAASGKGSHGEQKARPAAPSTRATGPRRSRERDAGAAAPPSGPPETGPSPEQQEPMLPLLVQEPRKERGPDTGGERVPASPRTTPVRVPSPPMDAGYVPVVARSGETRGPVGRWLLCAGVGGAAILTVHLMVSWEKLQPTLLVALALLIPGILVALINALMEWKATTLARALDELIVVAAVLATALPGIVALSRGGEGSVGEAALVPVGILVAVWVARAVEAFLGWRLESQGIGSSVHARGALASLFLVAQRVGGSRSARTARGLAMALTLAAVPAGLLVVLLAWLLTGRLGVSSYWSMAAAVMVSLSPRLLRNILPPVAAAGLLRARESGILFSDDREFEKAGAVDAMVLRKRGVLVEPGSEVVQFHHLGELPERTILALVASCEEIASRSELAEALIRHARREGVKPGDTRLTRWFASRGVQSTSPFGEVFVGNRLFLIENGISVGRGEEVAQEAEKSGNTAVFISIDRKIEAVAILENRLHSSARPAVDACRKLGIASVLVTGDSTRTAESIGQTLGVDQIRPEIAVGSREQELGRLRDSGYRLAVLGNVSTGPEASADQGDVHLALGWDGEASVDSRFSIIVRGSDLMGAVDALKLARNCRRFLRANWTVAVVVGGLCVGLAASGLAGPVLAALAANLAAAAMMAIRPKLARDR